MRVARSAYNLLDHIFPRAELRKKEFEEPEINHFGNFWILAKRKNQNKSDKHPATFFEDVSDAEMRRAVIDPDMLDYRGFRTFLKDRSKKIVEAVGFSRKETDGQGISRQSSHFCYKPGCAGASGFRFARTDGHEASSEPACGKPA